MNNNYIILEKINEVYMKVDCADTGMTYELSLCQRFVIVCGMVR